MTSFTETLHEQLIPVVYSGTMALSAQLDFTGGKSIQNYKDILDYCCSTEYILDPIDCIITTAEKTSLYIHFGVIQQVPMTYLCDKFWLVFDKDRVIVMNNDTYIECCQKLSSNCCGEYTLNFFTQLRSAYSKYSPNKHKYIIPSFGQRSIELNYCPFCGSKLDERKI
jgi:hypothetical protein